MRAAAAGSRDSFDWGSRLIAGRGRVRPLPRLRVLCRSRCHSFIDWGGLVDDREDMETRMRLNNERQRSQGSQNFLRSEDMTESNKQSAFWSSLAKRLTHSRVVIAQKGIGCR